MIGKYPLIFMLVLSSSCKLLQSSVTEENEQHLALTFPRKAFALSRVSRQVNTFVSIRKRRILGKRGILPQAYRFNQLVGNFLVGWEEAANYITGASYESFSLKEQTLNQIFDRQDALLFELAQILSKLNSDRVEIRESLLSPADISFSLGTFDGTYQFLKSERDNALDAIDQILAYLSKDYQKNLETNRTAKQLMIELLKLQSLKQQSTDLKGILAKISAWEKAALQGSPLVQEIRSLRQQAEHAVDEQPYFQAMGTLTKASALCGSIKSKLTGLHLEAPYADLYTHSINDSCNQITQYASLLKGYSVDAIRAKNHQVLSSMRHTFREGCQEPIDSNYNCDLFRYFAPLELASIWEFEKDKIEAFEQVYLSIKNHSPIQL